VSLTMGSWTCVTEAQCPFKGREFCGFKSKPIVRSYKCEKPEEREECYIEHVIRCWEEWRKKETRIVRPIFYRLRALGLGRAVSCDELKEMLGFMIVNHDLGKLTEIYQRYCKGERDKLGGFRHECISSYESLKLLQQKHEDPIPYFICSALYLHHEAQILSWRSRRYRSLRTPTFDYLLSHLSRFSESNLRFVQGAQEISEWLIKELAGIELRSYQLVPPSAGEVTAELGKMISIVDGSANASEYRLVVASFLLPLTLIDGEVAEVGRKCTGGT